MNSQIKRNIFWLAALLLAVLLSACGEKQSQVFFDTPEAAIQALSDLIGQRDDQRIEQVFGPGSLDMFLSGDDAADHADYQRVKEMIEEFKDHILCLIIVGVDFREELVKQELITLKVLDRFDDFRSKIFGFASLHRFLPGW